MIDLTGVVSAVLALCAALVTGLLVPWIKARATKAQVEMLQGVTKMLVCAAEQVLGSDEGEKKLELVKSWLVQRGFSVDTAMIENAVREMNLTDYFINQETTSSSQSAQPSQPAQPTQT